MNQTIKSLLDSMSLVSEAAVTYQDPTISGTILAIDKDKKTYTVQSGSQTFENVKSSTSHEIGDLVYLISASGNYFITYGVTDIEGADEAITTTIDKDYQHWGQVIYDNDNDNQLKFNQTTELRSGDGIIIDQDKLKNMAGQATALYLAVDLVKADFPVEFYSSQESEICSYSIKVYFSDDDVITIGIDDVPGYPFEITENIKLEKIIIPKWISEKNDQSTSPEVTKVEFVLENYPSGIESPDITFDNLQLDLLITKQAYYDIIAARQPKAVLTNVNGVLKVEIQDAQLAPQDANLVNEYTWYWKVKYNANAEDLVDWIEIPGVGNVSELNVANLQHRYSTQYKCDVKYPHRDYPTGPDTTDLLTSNEVTYINTNIEEINNGVYLTSNFSSDNIDISFAISKKNNYPPDQSWIYQWGQIDVLNEITSNDVTSSTFTKKLKDIDIAETIFCIVQYKNNNSIEFLAYVSQGVKELIQEKEITTETEIYYTLLTHANWGAPPNPRHCTLTENNSYSYTKKATKVDGIDQDGNQIITKVSFLGEWIIWKKEDTIEDDKKIGAILWKCEKTIFKIDSTIIDFTWSEIWADQGWDSEKKALPVDQLQSVAEGAKFWAGQKQGVYTTDAGDVHINASKIKTGALMVGESVGDALLYANVDDKKVTIAGWQIVEGAFESGSTGIFSGEKYSYDSLLSDNFSDVRFAAGEFLKTAEMIEWDETDEGPKISQAQVELGQYTIEQTYTTEESETLMTVTIKFPGYSFANINLNNILPKTKNGEIFDSYNINSLDLNWNDVLEVQLQIEETNDIESSIWTSEPKMITDFEMYLSGNNTSTPFYSLINFSADEGVQWVFNDLRLSQSGEPKVSVQLIGTSLLQENFSGSAIFYPKGFGVLEDGSVYADYFKSRTAVEASVIKAKTIIADNLSISSGEDHFIVATNSEIESILNDL